MKNDEPCPFCGEQPKVYTFDGTGKEGFTSGIRCENINCQVSAENAKPQPGEFDWNTRPLEDALRAERDEARAEVERLRAALEVYANPGNWFESDEGAQCLKTMLPGNHTAKNALEAKP